MNKERLFKLVLLLIILLSATLRLYQINQVPASISWDEAAVGYNAWSIANFGRDEWGNFFPPVFKSFEDDKHPVHIYFTAIAVRLLGLSEFSTRLPSAIFGVLNVYLIYLVGKTLFKNRQIGILAAFILAVSPYGIHFSRFNHELNFTIFFFLLGLVCFFQGLNKKNYLLALSFLFFGIDLLTYHSPKVVVPPMVLLLVLLYFKELIRLKGIFLTGVGILSLFIVFILLNPALTGRARINQTSFSLEEAKRTNLYQKTQNEMLGRAEITYNQYLSHFSPKYLFISGDKNPRLSSEVAGEFYPIEGLFLIIGLLTLIWKRSRISIILISWALLGPIPASLVNEAPHASRAMFMMGSWHLIAALGFFTLSNIFKNQYIKILILVVGISLYGFFLKNYIEGYFGVYAKQYAIEWQYGMKQAVEYVKDHNGYSQVFITAERSQPYIFFLYYLQMPTQEYLNTVSYNSTKSRSYNLVTFFDKYHFGDWDPIESYPSPGVLYILTPSEYSGLRHKAEFNVKKLIRYPNGSDAFFLVSGF